MKVFVKPRCFEWMTETTEASLFGSSAAKSFAKIARGETRKNEIAATIIDGQIIILAGNQNFDDWWVEAPLTKLMRDRIKQARADCAPESLENAAEELLKLAQEMTSAAQSMRKRTVVS